MKDSELAYNLQVDQAKYCCLTSAFNEDRTVRKVKSYFIISIAIGSNILIFFEFIMFKVRI
tara:strand:+ start:1203 stop:1385 length:183 start_codon:yes stop_codon:yes gene_type:complete